MYFVKYNSVTSESLDLLLYDYPEFSGAEKVYGTYPIAGGRGELVGTDDYISNLIISCKFSVKADSFHGKTRQIRKWLSGTGELSFSDSPDVYYQVQKINYDSIERELEHFGTFTVKFTCTPFEFLNDGKTPVKPSAGGILNNPGDTSRPIYIITGNGDCVLTVNGNTMKAIVTEDLTINTELMKSYRIDGTPKNTSVTGDYEELFLKEGENIVNITSGFTLNIIPKWGYNL